ncbi:MAG: hypothetical protein A3D94_22250 [Alphaproteobacteria bacterium RIFCSPHIGHO2_12_FULL_66_14]|nr:MAG: hypothetical protein A3D94_22250 [Alphaproteobacteria bacterium RIFCSPHIGHO2_12_FULL_66_14]
MQLDWESLVKRYVYNSAKTPYFTSVPRLNRGQARSELFVYTLSLTVLLGVIGVAALSPALPHGGAIGVPIYAFAVAITAVLFGLTKHVAAAAFCATAPAAALLYLALYGFQPDLGTGDRILLIAVLLLWLRYSWRILQIARAYPTLPDPGAPG